MRNDSKTATKSITCCVELQRLCNRNNEKKKEVNCEGFKCNDMTDVDYSFHSFIIIIFSSIIPFRYDIFLFFHCQILIGFLWMLSFENSYLGIFVIEF